MKLDRNIDGNQGRGKYALLLLRKLKLYDDGKTFGGLTPKIADAIKTLEDAGIIDWGTANTESEFFVIRLKDRYAHHALRAYALAAAIKDMDWSEEVHRLADRAGHLSPFWKNPD